MVKRITRNEINALPDFLTNGNFVMMFGTIPGTATTKRLTLQCKSTSVPGVSVERLSQELAGFERGQAGGKSWSHSLTVTFAETRDLYISKTLRSWMEMCRGTNGGISIGDSGMYTVNVDIYVFDNNGEMVKTCTLFKLFPTEFPDTEFQGATAQAMVEPQITFGYDYASNDELVEL